MIVIDAKQRKALMPILKEYGSSMENTDCWGFFNHSFLIYATTILAPKQRS